MRGAWLASRDPKRIPPDRDVMRAASRTWPVPPAALPERRKAFTVSKVVERAAQVLRDKAPYPFWVRGELSNWRRTRSGHCYFCLKDEKAELKCVLWNDTANTLP